MDWRRQRPSLLTENEVWQIRHLLVLLMWVLQFSMLWDQHSSPGVLGFLDGGRGYWEKFQYFFLFNIFYWRLVWADLGGFFGGGK